MHSKVRFLVHVAQARWTELNVKRLQDAEECWVQMTNALKEVPGLPGPSSDQSTAKKFVDQYMTGEMRRE